MPLTKRQLLLVCIVVVYGLYQYHVYRFSQRESYRQTASYFTSKDQLDPNQYYFKGTLKSTGSSTSSVVPTTQTCPNYPSTVYIPITLGKSRDKPARSPQELASYGYTNGYYWYLSETMTDPVYLYTLFTGGPDNRPWVLVFNSAFTDFMIRPVTVSDDDNLSTFDSSSKVLNLINGATQGYTRWLPISSTITTSTVFTKILSSTTTNTTTNVRFFTPSTTPPNTALPFQYKLTFMFSLTDAFNVIKLYFDPGQDTNPSKAFVIRPSDNTILTEKMILSNDRVVTIVLSDIYTLSSVQIRLDRNSSGKDMSIGQVEFYNREIAENKLNKNIPMDGLLVQHSAGKHLSYGYFPSTRVTFNTLSTDQYTPSLSSISLIQSSIEPQSLLIGGNKEGCIALFGTAGTHGIYNRTTVTSNSCRFDYDEGTVGAGSIFDSTQSLTCGTFPYDLEWGYGVSKSMFTDSTKTKLAPSFVPVDGDWNMWAWWDRRDMTGVSQSKPALRPSQLVGLGYPDGYYWYKPTGTTSPIRLFTKFNMADTKPWCLGVSIQHPNIVLVNNLNINLPCKGILFQNVRFVSRGEGIYVPLDHNVGYSYFSTTQLFNKRTDTTSTTVGGNRAGLSVCLGGSASHGFYPKDKVICSSNTDLPSFGPSNGLWLWKGNYPSSGIEMVSPVYLSQTWFWWE